MPEYQGHQVSCFFARGNQYPLREHPQNWMAWHFTHISNLPGIIQQGAVLPASLVEPTENVALRHIKQRRAQIPVRPDQQYPRTVVNEHVPWYFAAKSPMLYAVKMGHEDRSPGLSGIVFLGVNVGDVINSDLTWCASDMNASMAYAQFSREVNSLGTFIDFDLLQEKMWNKVTEDPDRPSRRAAELLILGAVPLDLISLVIVQSASDVSEVQRRIIGAGWNPEVRARPYFYS